MLAPHHPRLQTLVQLGPRPHAPVRGLDRHPVARADAALGRCRWVQLHRRIAGPPPQARQAPVPALAELRVLGTGQDQRVALGQLRARPRTDQRPLVVRQRREAVFQLRLGVELDLARRRGEPARDALLLLGVLPVARLERHPYPAPGSRAASRVSPPTGRAGSAGPPRRHHPRSGRRGPAGRPGQTRSPYPSGPRRKAPPSAARNCTSGCAAGLTSTPIFRSPRSKGLATGSTTSASSAVGFTNRSACT